MKVFSLSRYRFSNPRPPFRIGGRLERVEDRFLLADALDRLELKGDFSNCRHGDQIVARVLRENAGALECDRIETVTRSRREPQMRDTVCADQFARFVNEVREFFLSQGFHEIYTPTLVTCPGLEPSLEPFAVDVQKGRESRRAYLPTSPEIHLKKAMAQGFTDIFEIKNCFRKGEFSAHHENEFFMLEWYRGFADLDLVIDDLRMLAKVDAKITTWAELFRSHLEFELTPETNVKQLRELAARLNLHTTADDTFNDVFHRVVIDHIEPKFAAMGPLIVRDFSPSQAALARLTAEGWADRFEFFWNGFEIANAFFEVTDPEEQQKRWRAEQEERRHLGTSKLPQDYGLIEALECGLPPTAGIALGLERLFMAKTGVKDIRKLRLFSTDDLFAE